MNNRNRITSPCARFLCNQPLGALFIARFNQKRLSVFLILEAYQYIVKPDVETAVY